MRYGFQLNNSFICFKNLMSKDNSNPLQRNKQKLQEIKRIRLQKMNQMNQSSHNTSRADSTLIKRQLSSHKSQSLHVAPSIVETYNQQIQCSLEVRSLDSKPANHQDQEEDIQEVDLLQPKEHKRKRDQRKEHQIQALKAKQLSQEQLDTLVKSKHFNEFFNKSSKFLEKVLDNGDGDMIELLLKEGIKSKETDKHNPLTHVGCYSDPNFTANRVITDLDWSTQLSDLFLASYSQNQQGSIKDHVGVVLVWTPNLKTRPQFHCFCQSAVTSAKFFPYSNSTIVGGCYNGQLMLWDIRAKAMPVQRSGITGDGHKYPVNSLKVVGTQIANNIISFSNDGMMGVWDIKQLSKPVRINKFQANRPTKNTKPSALQGVAGRSSVTSTSVLERRDEVHDVNVTCCQFPPGDVNKYYVGSLNGAMYKNTMHNTNIQQIAMYDEHEAPISSISINNPSSQYQSLSGLVLTSSFDWTVKLWSPNAKQSMRTFEHSDDYVYDVCWNPSNPSIFASVNNDGIMDLFDLTKDVEQPIGHTKINNYAQNKCRWNSDGSIIISGDSAGNINMMVLNEKLRKLDTTKLEDFENILVQSKEQN